MSRVCMRISRTNRHHTLGISFLVAFSSLPPSPLLPSGTLCQVGARARENILCGWCTADPLLSSMRPCHNRGDHQVSGNPPFPPPPPPLWPSLSPLLQVLVWSEPALPCQQLDCSLPLLCHTPQSYPTLNQTALQLNFKLSLVLYWKAHIMLLCYHVAGAVFLSTHHECYATSTGNCLCPPIYSASTTQVWTIIIILLYQQLWSMLIRFTNNIGECWNVKWFKI